jgi:hypothetical protein
VNRCSFRKGWRGTDYQAAPNTHCCVIF